MFSITHLYAATTLIEIGSLRLLTDPVFDPAGTESRFGFGTHSRKRADPPVRPEDVGPIDAVLLSHDHHADNLDATGRTLLPLAKTVLTTHAGASRLGANSVGLQAGQQIFLTGSDGLRVRVTATPARHGPPLSLPFVGPVIGFLLEWEAPSEGSVWISGDTVWFGALASFFGRRHIGTAILHLGCAKFGSTGPIRYTMNTKDAIEATRLLDPVRVIPVHYEGFTHFSEGRREVEYAFAAANLADRLTWLPYAQRIIIEGVDRRKSAIRGR